MSHQAADELIQSKLKQFVLHTIAAFMLYRRQGILDH